MHLRETSWGKRISTKKTGGLFQNSKKWVFRIPQNDDHRTQLGGKNDKITKLIKNDHFLDLSKKRTKNVYMRSKTIKNVKNCQKLSKVKTDKMGILRKKQYFSVFSLTIVSITKSYLKMIKYTRVIKIKVRKIMFFSKPYRTRGTVFATFSRYCKVFI